MAKQWSVEEIVASLEAEAAAHREQAAHHTEQEAFHREKRTHHEAELEAITRRLDEFRAASAAALELVKRLAPQQTPAAGPPNEGMDIGPASKPRLTKIVESIVAELGTSQAFGPGWLTDEANRRHGDKLRKPVTARQMSDVLRRLTRQSRLRQVREGKGRYEARFVRVG
ncbi:MAG TPA: hypothetical protein VEW48_05095 [Thermoanaerobaculia bacterium]|nr:hypothetical protein [Thermoanaerobaculia bacterium]